MTRLWARAAHASQSPAEATGTFPGTLARGTHGRTRRRRRRCADANPAGCTAVPHLPGHSHPHFRGWTRDSGEDGARSRGGGLLTVRCFVQTAGAAPLRPGRAERGVMRRRGRWKRAERAAAPVSPGGGPGACGASFAASLPYGVGGDTGKEGVGGPDSLPFLLGEKTLPSTPSRFGGYAAITVWKRHGGAGSGVGRPGVGRSRAWGWEGRAPHPQHGTRGGRDRLQ